MHYYLIYPADTSYQKEDALTYVSVNAHVSGQLVVIPFRTSTIVGVVSETTTKPKFATKSIIRTLEYTLDSKTLALHHWLISYYPRSSGAATQLFIPPDLAKTIRSKTEPSKIVSPAQNRSPLTKEQEEVLIRIQMPQTYLLHGETGSGKTRVYAELARRTLAAQKSVLILVPEIGLLASVAHELARDLGTKVYLSHSNQIASVRREMWRKVSADDEPIIVVAPRSGLFLPYRNLGLIVIDESHDNSYKHEQPPHFATARVAAVLARLHNSILVLGSATPSVEDYYTATKKGAPILRMSSQAKVHEAVTEATIIDLKDRRNFTKHRYLSNDLLAAIKAAMERKEQSLILLNRRGTARVTLCENCDWQALCPRCDRPLTYHGDEHLLRCHACGFRQPAPSSCPNCGSHEIVFKSIGTKSLVETLQKIFPSARIRRFDSDSKAHEKLEHNITSLRAGEADIIIGTQMLAKGLDLPLLSVVGVLVADSGLFFPDYTASEKTFQLLYQVMGRVGRGHTKGHVYLQTYNPNSDLMRQALAKDWQSFYDTELKDRRMFKLPPFSHVLKLIIKRKSIASSEKAATVLHKSLQEKYPKLGYIGPGPAFQEKQSGVFVWQLVITSPKRAILLEIIKSLPSNIQFDIDPSDLL